MQHDEATPGQHVPSDLGTEVMEFCKECRGEILLPLRVGTEKGRDQRGGRTLLCKWHHGTIDHRDDVGRQNSQRYAEDCEHRQGRPCAEVSLGRVGGSLDMPRKPIANTFAKHVTASPAVNANKAPEIAKTILIGVEDSTAERSIVCSVSHSLTNPLSGGSAEIDNTPTRKKALVHGIRRTMPPRRSRSRVPAPASTAPVPTKRSALYTE